MRATDKNINKLILLSSVLLLAGLFYLLIPILTPFLFGAILAYLSNPIVDQLMRLSLSRRLSVVIVFTILLIILTLLIILFVPLIQDQIAALSHQVPKMGAWLEETVLPWIQKVFKVDLKANFSLLSSIHSENMMQASSSLLQTMLHSGKTVFEVLLALILTPVVTFYLLRDWDLIACHIHKFIPRRMEPTIVKLVKECDMVLSGFLRGQLLVMFSLGIFYALALSLLGLQFGILIGAITGVISIMPYLGMIIGFLITAIASVMQFGTFTSILWALLIFGIGHGFENAYLSPKLIGERVGLHPIVVIFSILAGGKLFGFFGVLLALPVTAIAMVLLRYALQRYYKGKLYKNPKQSERA